MERRACEGVRRHRGRGNAGISLGPHRPACIRVFPKVYVDAGLATHNLGSRAPALLAEALELAPYRTFLYSSDASGPPELHDLRRGLFQRAPSDFLAAGLQEDPYIERTVARLTRKLCAENAGRAHRLGDQTSQRSARAQRASRRHP